MPLTQSDGVPLLTGGKDAKSLIVGVLSKEFPLTAKQIYARIVKEYPSLKLTYQGVHKAVGQLSDQGIVDKLDKAGYRLGLDWIRNVKEFGHRVESAYVGQNIVAFTDIADNSTVSITFPSFLQALYWFLHQMGQDYASNPEPDTTIGVWYHVWPFIMCTDEDFKRITLIMSKGTHYALSPNNTPLDQFMMSFMTKLGKAAKLGVKCDTLADILITRDLYIQFFLPNGLKKKLDDVYNKSKLRPKIGVTELYSLYADEGSPITVIVIKNKGFVKEKKSEILTNFF